LLRSPVPVGNNSIHVLANNSVFAGLDNGCKTLNSICWQRSPHGLVIPPAGIILFSGRGNVNDTSQVLRRENLRPPLAGIVGEEVRRERRWTSAGATPARELVRSTRKQSERRRRKRSRRSFRCRGSLGDSASVQAITCHFGPKRPAKTHENHYEYGTE